MHAIVSRGLNVLKHLLVASLFVNSAAASTITGFSPPSGLVGATITVSGTNFTSPPSSNQVGFSNHGTGTSGGYVISNASAGSSTSLTATVPIGATTGPIEVVNSQGTAYSSTDFVVTTPPPPSILSFSPPSGLIGATVTITGTNFTSPPSSNEVGFSMHGTGTEGAYSVATVTAGTSTSLTVTVPIQSTTGPIEVVNEYGTAYSSTNFVVTNPPPPPAPTITGFSPPSGLEGAPVTITGTNFDATTGNDQLEFSSAIAGSYIVATVTAASTTSRSTTVPHGAVTGPIRYVNANGTAVSPNSFIVTTPPPPSILSFSPGSGLISTPVTITGTNFTSPPSSNEVGFSMHGTGTGGAYVGATVTGGSATSLNVTVPAGSTTGPIEVVNEYGTAYSSTNFVVTNPPPPPAPTITGFSPPSGLEGAPVTVTGTNFDATAGNDQLEFSSAIAGSYIVATVTAASTTSRSTTVPHGAVTGPIRYVNVNGTAVSPSSFVVTTPPPPSILSFNPPSGLIGATVTITGTNFTTPPSSNEVGFSMHGTGTGGAYVGATVTAGTSTSLTVTVPSQSTTGPIEVVNQYGTAYSSTDFVVTNPPPPPAPTITGFSPPSGLEGAPVTVTGTNFDATTGNDQLEFSSAIAGSYIVATVTAASTTSRSTTVPHGAVTGPIRYVNVNGTAVSPSSFVVTTPPPPSILSFSPPGGLIGTTVTITGTNFTSPPSSNEVGFSMHGTGTGGAYSVATVTAGTSTSLTVTVPIQSTTGPIEVVNQYGTAYSSTNFVVATTNAPTCTSVAANNPTLPPGTPTQRVYAYGVQNATSVQFSTWWTLGSPSGAQVISGSSSGDGTWFADIDLSVFDPWTGNFETDVTMSNSYYNGGQSVACGTAIWMLQGNDNGPATPPSPQLAATPPVDAVSDAVGATGGKFSVDQSGNAQYDIPLYAPKGAGGLTPTLGLTYNSSNGDGYFGYGWQLRGLSSISICRKGQEHGDGAGSGGSLTTDPQYTVYCLDGQRLDLISGQNGAAGALYRLESDNLTEIVIESANTTDGQGSLHYTVPTVFAAYGKDGTVKHYGGSAATLRYVPGATGGYTVSWYEYELADASGNSISFNYAAPTPSIPAALSPVSITYIGGEIDFATSQRPANQRTISYQGGVPVITNPVWISSITVKSQGTVLRTYTPGYESKAKTGSVSLINSSLRAMVSLQECGGSGTSKVCYDSLKFNWADMSPLVGTLPPVQVHSASDSTFFHAIPSAVRFGDADGDGRSDVVFLHCDDSSCGYRDFIVGYSVPSRTGGAALGTVDICNPDGNDSGDYNPNGSCPQFSKFLDYTKGWQLVDYNGDGRSDLLMLEPVSGSGQNGPYRIVVWESTGGTPTAPANPFTQKVVNIAATDVVNGQLASMTFNEKVDTFVADFDGDGIPDLLTLGNTTGLKLWLRKPTGVAAQPYAFQGPYAFAAGSPQYPVQCGIGALTTQSLRTADFNGDGRADLVLRLYGGPCSGINGSTPGVQFVTNDTFNQTLISNQATNAPSLVEYLQVFTASGVSGASFYFQPSQGLLWQVGSNNGQTGFANVAVDTEFQVGDINGDGLADVMFAGDVISNNSTPWIYEINHGGTRGPSTCVVVNAAGNGCVQSLGVGQTQLGDYDGDGKADFWTVEAWQQSGTNVSVVHLSNGQGFETTAVATSLYSGDIGTSPSWFGYLADLDGDGFADALEINPLDGHGAWQTARTSLHHQPRNVITSVTSGLGAVTAFSYAPLTYRSVYDREYNAQSLVSGWGSPVQDVLMPRYVVEYADSSAPIAGNPDALSTIRYRYSGFKMQGGGRGWLGFDSVSTIDAQTGIETITHYNQAFPLTGLPSETIAQIPGQAVDTVCDPAGGGDPDSAACMKYGTVSMVAGKKSVISDIVDVWNWHIWNAASDNTPPSAAAPFFLYRSSSTQQKNGLDGTLFSSQQSTFQYDKVYGNLLGSTTKDYLSTTLTDANLIRTTTTTESYDNIDNPPNSTNGYVATWLIGRLRQSQTTVQGYGRDSIASSGITRKSSFDYDPTTELMTAEHLQSGGAADQALDKYHFRDAATGNEIETVTCSASAACSPTVPLAAASMTFNNAGDANWVQRYTRVQFDSNGIYANTTYEPYWNGGGASEQASLVVNSRDGFGNVLNSQDEHGVTTARAFSALGREYFSATSAGTASQTVYRWCTGHVGVSAIVPCPDNASYRVQTDTTIGTGGIARSPVTWAYFDVLARPVLTVRQGFASDEYSAVTVDYDSLGRVARESVPFFTFAPDSSNVGTPVSGQIYYTTTHYDALGRIGSITAPNGSTTVTTYTGLNAAVVLPQNGSGQPEHRTQTFNHLGNPVLITDSVGSTISQVYDPASSLTQVTRTGNDGKAATSSATYDALGRKSGMTDPDAGSWSYGYNAAGEQVKRFSSTGKLACTATRYDGRGRAFSRVDYNNAGCSGTADMSTSWTYDVAAGGLGLLATSTSTDSGAASTEVRNAYYDAYGRVRELDTTLNSILYRQLSTYDQYARPFQSLFSGTNIPESGELYLHNSQGYLAQTLDAEHGYSGQTYRVVLAMDARSNIVKEQRAANPALTTVREYAPDTGWLSSISTGNESGESTDGSIENLSYGYDALGNLMTRADLSAGTAIYEVSTYDSLQRLTGQQIGASSGSTLTTELANTYDSLGNITNGGNTYGTYPASGGPRPCSNAGEVTTAGPDAITTKGQATFCYDSHGNQTRTVDPTNVQTVERQMTYSADDALRSVATVTSYSAHTTKWGYGADRQRAMRSDYANASGTGTPVVNHYVGSVEIDNAAGSTRTVKRYVDGMVLTQTPGWGSPTVQALYKYDDNLGSTHRLVSPTGAVQNPNGAQWFTAFGSRANALSGAVLGTAASFNFDDSLTHHGFTGHEMMDESGLVHMGGRVYDPALGRFVQADPYVTEAANLQGLNRYSYVLNNPLSAADPTGYWGRRQQGYLREVIAIAISIYAGVEVGEMLDSAGGWEAASLAVQETAVTETVMSGFVSGFVSSGDLNGAVDGAFEAGLNLGIGNLFPSGTLRNVGAHALEGGVMSSLQGGRFGHGFISAGLSAAVNPHIDTGNKFTDGVAASIVGGTISSVTGGSFKNGALTSAFEYSFNCMVHGCYGLQLTEGGAAAGVAAGAVLSVYADVVTVGGNIVLTPPEIWLTSSLGSGGGYVIGNLADLVMNNEGTPSSPEIKPSDVAGKSPQEIDKVAKDSGLVPKGPNPEAGQGSYVDPVTGKQRVLIHPDADCGPHCHVNDPQGNRLDVNGHIVEPESPEAHLPLGQSQP